MYNEQCTCVPCPKVAPHSSTSSLTCCEENRRWWGVHSVSQHIYLHCTPAYLTTCVSHQKFHWMYIYLTIPYHKYYIRGGGRTQRFTAHLPYSEYSGGYTAFHCTLYICVSHQKFHCIYNIHLSHDTIPHILHYFTQLLYTKQETTIPRHCSSIYIKSFCTASHNACFLAYKWTFMHPNWWLIGTACFLF